MPDLASTIATLNNQGTFTRIVNDPLAQLGPEKVPFLGAELLPEKLVPENYYKEEAVQFRTIIANDADRYSPVQLKEGAVVASMIVDLVEIDHGSEMKGPTYDTLVKKLQESSGTQGLEGGGVPVPTMQAMAMSAKWADTTLAQPLAVKQEKQRWEAMYFAIVTRSGDNGFRDTIQYPNPQGHRFNAAGQWSDPTYDPYNDLMYAAELLAAKGFGKIAMMVTCTPVRSKLTLNAKMLQRIGHVSVAANGTVVNQPAGRATLAQLNEFVAGDGLPPIRLNDRQYHTATGSNFYFPRNGFMLIAETPRDQSIDRADLEPLPIQNTLGYQAVGRPTGAAAPGKVVHVEPKADKPPRLEGQAWTTTLPVILQPEAIVVIQNIS